MNRPQSTEPNPTAAGPSREETALEVVTPDSRVLDLGCGNDKMEGAYGVDWDSTSDADLQWNLNELPYPLPPDHFEFIRMQDVIEHLDDIPRIMAEVYRLCRPGAEVLIRTPHYTSMYAYADPTHRHYYSLFSMDYFIPGCAFYRPSWGSRFELVERTVDVGKIHRLLGMKWLAENQPEKYEKYLAHLCPILNLHFRLRAVK